MRNRLAGAALLPFGPELPWPEDQVVGAADDVDVVGAVVDGLVDGGTVDAEAVVVVTETVVVGVVVGVVVT
jgi:hypothetical protein